MRAIGPRLRLLLYFIFGLVAILAANSVYLSAITFLEWLKTDPNTTYQNWFYMVMFGTHLGLGLLIVLPIVIFGMVHIKNAHDRPNRRAVQVGYLLFFTALAVLVTGLLLTRIDIFHFKNVGLKDPRLRSIAYWAHVITPILGIWLYILHRLAGPRIKWRVGLRWGAAVGVLTVGMVLLHSAHPRKNQVGSVEGKKYFNPSLARTASGNFIPARTLMMDNYCLNCHQDAYNDWFHSAHHFSSFNNKPYLFSVRETRQVSLKRDGNVKAARWCAGCHDVVPFFSGAFDNPNYDDVHDPTSQAGITCTACHAITHVNSTKGNADYTIDEPIHYPFAYSTNRILQYINQQLVKGKPEFHKKTFLKPFMRTAEYRSTCHKVSIPGDLNHYKDFLRGHNHYDPYLLSGVSGTAPAVFTLRLRPRKTAPAATCRCRRWRISGRLLQPHEYLDALYSQPSVSGSQHRPRVHPRRHQRREDRGGVPEGVAAGGYFWHQGRRRDDDPLTAPLRPAVPALKRGHRYLLEVVLRTMKLGHLFTQGTVDSNEVWVDSKAEAAAKSSDATAASAAMRWTPGRISSTSICSIATATALIAAIRRIFSHRSTITKFAGRGPAADYDFTVPEDQNGPLTVEVNCNTANSTRST